MHLSSRSTSLLYIITRKKLLETDLLKIKMADVEDIPPDEEREDQTDILKFYQKRTEIAKGAYGVVQVWVELSSLFGHYPSSHVNIAILSLYSGIPQYRQYS